MKDHIPKMEASYRLKARKGCPTCGHCLTTKRRNLYDMMAMFLHRLVRIHKLKHYDEFVTSEELYPRRRKEDKEKRSTDGTYLRFWGLIEHRRGAFRPTELGYAFVDGQLRVPVWIEFASDHGPHPIQCSEEMIDFTDALRVLEVTP